MPAVQPARLKQQAALLGQHLDDPPAFVRRSRTSLCIPASFNSAIASMNSWCVFAAKRLTLT